MIPKEVPPKNAVIAVFKLKSPRKPRTASPIAPNFSLTVSAISSKCSNPEAPLVLTNSIKSLSLPNAPPIAEPIPLNRFITLSKLKLPSRID